MYDETYNGSDKKFDNVKIYDPRKTGKIKVLDVPFSMDNFDSICQYVYDNKSQAISESSLMNVKILFELIDTQPYSINDELMARIEFIRLVLEAKLVERIDKKNLIDTYVLRNCSQQFKEIIENEIFGVILKNTITDSECSYINEMVYEYLIESSSFVYSKRLSNILEKKDSGKYAKIRDFSEDVKKLMRDFDNDLRMSEEFSREGNGFDLNDGNMNKKIKKYLSQLKSPTNKLKSGLQYLNKMLNGGFESGRSYLFMGITGVGKSITLLSVALWIRKYNKVFQTDGTRSAVLFISQENSEIETFERIFNITVSGKDIRDFDEDSIMDGLRDAGLADSKPSDGDIDFIFKFFSDKEIGVTDIDSMIDDYKRKGITIVAVIQDYIEKLCPKYKASELRTSLGNIATELSELAKKRNIPVISAAQLNRTASSLVNSSSGNNKTNTTKLLGKQNISESWDIMKNVDSVIIINREEDIEHSGREYLGFKLEKLRGRPSKDKIYLFIHPFDPENSILLTDDIDLPVPISKLEIEDFSPMASKSKENSLGKPMFSEQNDDTEFINSIKELVSDEFYEDTDKYVDMYKKADEKTEEMKKIESHHRIENGCIIVEKRLPIEMDKNKCIIVKKRKVG